MSAATATTTRYLHASGCRLGAHGIVGGPRAADAGAHSRSAENADTSECIVIRHDAPAASSQIQMEKPMNKREAAKKYSGDQLDALALGAGIALCERNDEALRSRLLAAYDTEDAAAEQARRDGGAHSPRGRGRGSPQRASGAAATNVHAAVRQSG